MRRQLYFAYGSNLNQKQMALRCPGARPIGPAHLKGWELEFRRVLTIVQKTGAVVEGGLWEITQADEVALDRYEGFPGWYDKRMVTVQTPGEGRVQAMTYILEKGEPALPSQGYLDTCLEGCMAFDIDPVVMYRALYKLQSTYVG